MSEKKQGFKILNPYLCPNKKGVQKQLEVKDLRYKNKNKIDPG
jgi:hypothetical protein